VPHVLHLLKDPTNLTALEVIRAQATQPGVRVSVVLLHEAHRLAGPLPGDVYRLEDAHLHGPSAPGVITIGSSDLLALIFAADRVVSW
jgi:hypothetical protein